MKTFLKSTLIALLLIAGTAVKGHQFEKTYNEDGTFVYKRSTGKSGKGTWRIGKWGRLRQKVRNEKTIKTYKIDENTYEHYREKGDFFIKSATFKIVD